MAEEAATVDAPALDKPPLQEAAVDEETRALIVPNAADLPAFPPSAVEANFARYFVADFPNPGHDQYVYRHPNGLCVVGLAPAHVAFKEEGGIAAVDFNVGKADRSEIKVTGKRKRNAQHLQENSALCKACTNDKSYVVRCCVKGSLLEINDRLIKQPDLLNTSLVVPERKAQAPTEQWFSDATRAWGGTSSGSARTSMMSTRRSWSRSDALPPK